MRVKLLPPGTIKGPLTAPAEELLARGSAKILPPGSLEGGPLSAPPEVVFARAAAMQPSAPPPDETQEAPQDDLMRPAVDAIEAWGARMWPPGKKTAGGEPEAPTERGCATHAIEEARAMMRERDEAPLGDAAPAAPVPGGEAAPAPDLMRPAVDAIEAWLARKFPNDKTGER